MPVLPIGESLRPGEECGFFDLLAVRHLRRDLEYRASAGEPQPQPLPQGLVSTVLLLGIVLVVLVAATAGLVFWRSRRDQDDDLGLVSHQWITEQRFGHDRNSQR